MPPRHFLTISGSLRAQSVNTAVLLAFAKLAPCGIDVVAYRGLAELPAFNPDLDTPAPPEAVAALREQIDRSDALVVCSPEYAHGVPGSLKNALDWLVSHPRFVGKPVALINARPRAVWANAALRETLAAMNARLVEGACVGLPLEGNQHNADTLLAMPEVAGRLTDVLAALIRATNSADR